jgi:hypothetical protein
MTAPTSFVYVTGDRKKTPVDPGTQPQGTELTLVLESGREIPYAQGKRVMNDPVKRVAAWKKAMKNDTEGS